MIKKIIAIGILCIFIISSAIVTTSGLTIECNYEPYISEDGDGKTEYWALIVGVDYTEVWPYDFSAEQMYNLLLTSVYWDKDHMRLLTNENATKINIIKAFKWLDKMDDGDDICLIYYCGHGGSSKFNYFPFDLRDRGDEYITTWKSENRFVNLLSNITKNFKLINSWLSSLSPVITDDYFNHMLNKLDSKGVAVILHSCYSGGMIESYWIGDFVNKLRKEGRVIMTACEENDTGWNFIFSDHYMMGLQGYADIEPVIGNKDGKISAEEAFFYAQKKTKEEIEGGNSPDNPQIDDNYDGELILTEKNLPPSEPDWIDAPKIGKTNTTYFFNVSAKDPESDEIRYGYDWHNERFSTWCAEVDEWSKYTEKSIHSFSHSWDKPGIYHVSIKSQDENGTEKIYRDCDYSSWSDTWTIIITDNEFIDQYHTKVDSCLGFSHCLTNDEWNAQSFIPNESKLSKIKLFLALRDFKSPRNITLFIRKNLTEDNLLEINKKFEFNQNFKVDWYEFDFEDISIIPGQEYFIILKSDAIDVDLHWLQTYDEERYEKGTQHISQDSGITWNSWDWNKNDFCFITYG